MQFDPWSAFEAVAALGNLVYTVLMLYEKRSGWLFGVVASAMGIALFLHQHVYAQAALSGFYVVMGLYGWWSWGRDDNGGLAITRKRTLFHLSIIGIAAVLAYLASLALGLFPDAQHTGLDGFVTAISLLAVWMLARKILENWAYWIIADLAAIYLYVLLGLWWYAALYVVYVVLSTTALLRWYKQWKATQVG